MTIFVLLLSVRTRHKRDIVHITASIEARMVVGNVLGKNGIAHDGVEWFLITRGD